ncbi:MAG: alpha/beta fold hydrolase [Acidimicrobiaceae bacterium]|nr:alpha/beta hydrolase [Acidimicrobiaceae bacterium]MXW62449.1 alpha/beta fold hydrolase [Acidimicrobiaceae bacterium]MXW77367.1 alpha/beta fold hydrolase [Acidimicrobiaceae bacterium]MYC41415.1 alpha/beta fold hydrolase [Acidimicrobiaceae bacterium]MYD06468.1 alpha/beta fold hydrolase [Acidimicrobiaceae bacterium]
MPFIEVNDLTMYYELHGQGPNLLHISGSGGDLRQTAPHLHGLNTDFRGLHYDQRCLGQTTLGDHEPTMFDYADDAAALCAVLGWRHARVVGTSFGGMVAQHLAIRHPDLVERLVLNCTSPGGELASYPLDELQDVPATERAEMMLALLDTRYSAGSGDELDGLEGFTSQLRDGYAQSASAESAEGFAKQLEARRHHDVTAGLGLISAPTLVCAGRYDGIAPVANSEAIVSGIAEARLEVFEGGHIFMLQDPRSLSVTREFLLR